MSHELLKGFIVLKIHITQINNNNNIYIYLFI